MMMTKNTLCSQRQTIDPNPKDDFELWHKIQEEDILCKVNEAQALFNKNEKQNKTNKLGSEAIL